MSSYEFPAFNAGYRTCLGQNMAILEASILLIKLLQNFTFTLVNNNISYNPKLILSVKDGLNVRLFKKNWFK